MPRCCWNGFFSSICVCVFLCSYKSLYNGHRAYCHTCQLSGFWTESPSFSSHQNLTQRRLKYPSFEHHEFCSRYWGRPYHWFFSAKPRRTPSEVDHCRPYDVACSSAQSSSSLAVPSGMTISRPFSNSQCSPSRPIARSRMISSTFLPIHFAVLPLCGVLLVLGLPRRRFPCTMNHRHQRYNY